MMLFKIACIIACKNKNKILKLINSIHVRLLQNPLEGAQMDHYR